MPQDQALQIPEGATIEGQSEQPSAPVSQAQPDANGALPLPQGAVVEGQESQSGNSDDAMARSDAYKHQVYSQASDHFKNGNYMQSAKDLLGLFHNPENASTNTVLSHAANTSGLSSVAHLIPAEAAHRVQMYNSALEALKKGDHKTAAMYAYAAISGADKNDPLFEAAKSIIATPYEEAKAAIEADKKARETGDKKLQADAYSHALGAVPIAGPILQQTTKDLGNAIGGKEDASAVGGDVLGVLGTLGFGKLLGGAGEVEGEAAPRPSNVRAGNSGLGTGVRPSEIEIAGEKVPVSQAQLPDAQQSVGTKVAKQFASHKGAQKFIDERVQPAAQKAAQSNFSQAGLSQVEKLQQLRGETPAEAPVLNTVDDIAKHLETEAQKTYKTLDEASKADSAAAKSSNPNTDVLDASGKPVDMTKQTAQPKAFTELQSQIRDAEQTLKSRTASTTEKGAAKEALPGLQKEMTDFLQKHGDAVAPGELDAADAAWQSAQRYKWIAKKMRVATKGTEGTDSVLAQKPTQLNPKSLENMPGQFDNKFGQGSFQKLLGDEGVKNFNDIQNVLRNPIERSAFEEWLHKTVLGAAGFALEGPLGGVGALVGKIGLKHFADNLLFNPEFGQGMMKAWNAAKNSRFVKDESGEMVVPFTGGSGTWAGTAEGAAADTAAFKQAQQELGEGATLGEVLKRAQELKGNEAPKPVSTNGSGESAASQEAINRTASEKAQGIKRFRIDTRSGQEVPLIGSDAVDAKAGPYDVIVQRGPQGEVELDSGPRARAYNKKLMSSTEGALAGPRGRL